MISNNVLDLIGNTPMVKINKLVRKNDATILAKVERVNIGGSIKDRIAKYMIEKAEKEGKLTKDKIILACKQDTWAETKANYLVLQRCRKVYT